MKLKRIVDLPDEPNYSFVFPDNDTNLKFWYPKIEGLVPTPKTIMIEVDQGILWKLLDHVRMPDGYDAFLDQLAAAASEVGYPCFLRTGHTSGKHEWKHTCFVEREDEFNGHVFALVDFSGCVDLPFGTWVVREMLATQPLFYAFQDMPITREFRFFVNDGKIVHRQPYWPIHSLEGYTKDDTWRSKYDQLIVLDETDRQELDRSTIAVNEVVPGFWSVDWLWANDKWYLTDMAEGVRSFAYDPTTDERMNPRYLVIE